MTRRRIHGIAVNATLALVSVFFLCSPTTYAYFSEMRMSYGMIPSWFASSAPARVTMRLFDRFNARAPRADRFGANIGCYAEARGAAVLPRCAYAIHPGDTLAGPPLLKISSGAYVARYDFSRTADCAEGDLRVQVRTVGPFHRIVAETIFHAVPGQHTEMPFALDVGDAALHAIEFRVLGLSGCVVLRHWDWGDAPAR